MLFYYCIPFKNCFGKCNKIALRKKITGASPFPVRVFALSAKTVTVIFFDCLPA